jgi:anti-anti-sigma factor
MDITEDRRDAILILGLSGRLDAGTSKMFEEKILAKIDSGERLLVVDLSQLDYISSAGLRVFLLGAKRLNSVSGKILLCCLKAHIKQVFDIAGFSSILSLYNSREEAVKSLQSP